MKKTFLFSGLVAMLGIATPAQITRPVLPPGKIAVFKAGTSDTHWPMVTARVAPCFVQVFDTVTNSLPLTSTNPLVSVALATNASVPGSVWINHHAGSEGGGISRSVDRQFLALEGYTGNILSPTAAKPSTDPTVYRGVVTLDAFTNAVDVYSSRTAWFGIPVGAASGTQDNPTGIATTDGTNFWGTGNFAGVSGELDGTLFYNPNQGDPEEVQNYLQAAGEARVIGGTLYVATKSATGVASGVYNFVDPSSGQVVPLPWDPDVDNPYYNFAFTNLYINWGSTFKNILNFDMDPANTVAYGADQTYGIVKFTNNAGTWVPAPYYFSATNLGTLKQTTANQGCFGICVDFSGTNPVIYATTMENGTVTNFAGGLGVNTTQGHQNNNRLIKIVDTGAAPGTALVAQTLAIAATTNEFFGGIDFTPDLRPLITTNPASYSTISGGSAAFIVAAQSVYALNYQWFQNGTNLSGQTSAALNLSSLDPAGNGFTYQCVITNNYGAVTSTPALLTVNATAVKPVISSGTNHVNGYINSAVTFAAVAATGTQPFTTYQWYDATRQPLADDGVKYSGSTTASLTISNLTSADSGNYYMAIGNSAGISATNLVDVLAVNYHLATISAGQPSAVTTFVGTPTTLTAGQSGATLPITNQWYKGATVLAEGSEYSGTTTATLTISATTTNDTGTNYYIVVSNGGGSVTSSVAAVTVMLPPAHSSVSYSNQIYIQNFDALPNPGTAGSANGVANASGVSVNSINNPKNPGSINGVAYSLANPFDFAYPVIINSYIGGLGLSAGPTNLNGWYGAADNLTNAVYSGNDGITRFGAQDGDQSTGGVIDFGPNDVNGGIIGTNRALGLITTSSTGSTTFALKLVNTTTNTLNYLNLSFVGELWRNNVNPRTMSFGYVLDDTATNFVLDTQSISNGTQVPGLAFSFPTNAAGVLAMDGTQPANQINLATNNLALSSPWHTNGALWLIWSMNTSLNAGSGQGYAIDNLNVSGTVVPTTVPLATTAAASKITATNATLNATVNPSNGPTVCWFQYGSTTSYGSATPANLLGTVSGTATLTNLIAGLVSGQTYHYRVVATNIAGTSLGADATLTTPAAPTVATLTASNLTAGSATLDASVNPNGTATAYWFKYGLTTSYGSVTVTNTLTAGSSLVGVTNSLAGLLQGTVYHYQVAATNTAGTSLGTDVSFTTLAVTPPRLGAVTLHDGALGFAFTNATGASFSVLATTNLLTPKAAWPVVGYAVESPAGSGNYQFTNTAATNAPLFYLLRQP
jgi:hypothetical protein